MTVTKIAPKVQDVTKIASEDIISPEVVDSYGKLAAKLARKVEKLEPLSNKVSVLAEQIINSVDEVIDSSVKYTVTGDEYQVQLGARGNKTSLNSNETIIDEIGHELFMKLAKVSVTDLKAYCTPDQLTKLTTAVVSPKRKRALDSCPLPRDGLNFSPYS